MGLHNECSGTLAGTLHRVTGVVLACAALLGCGGCSIVGMGRREPMVMVNDVPYAPSASERPEEAVARAARLSGWTADAGIGSVRCSRMGPTWRCVVDVLCGPTSFSIQYVDSFGMNYAGDGTVHPGYNKHVLILQNSIAMQMGGSGVSTPRKNSLVAVAPVSAQSREAPYELQVFKRDLEGSYRFEFRLKASTSGGVDVLERIKDELRRLVLKDAPGGVQPGMERLVEFVEFSQSEGRVSGRAVLKNVQVVEELEFIFDPDMGNGRMVVGYAPGRIVDARNWARDNIARRMKDKHASFLSRFGVEPHYTTEGERSFAGEDGRQKLEVRFHVTQ